MSVESETEIIVNVQMDDMGTISAYVTLESPDGLRGHTQWIYPLGHPLYDAVLGHVGGLEVGEIKTFYEWPENLIPEAVRSR